jgi:hypothetical protein
VISTLTGYDLSLTMLLASMKPNSTHATSNISSHRNLQCNNETDVAARMLQDKIYGRDYTVKESFTVKMKLNLEQTRFCITPI